MSDIVKQGYVKFQSKNLGVWKKRWIQLKMKSSNGPLRLEKYKDEAAALSYAGAERRIIDLSRIDCLERLSDSVKRHGIVIVVDGFETIQFCTDSEMEAETWLKIIQGEVSGAGSSRDTFPVYLMKNPKLGTHGDCTMQVTPSDVRLLDHRNNEIVAWPLNKIRRYGVERSMFTIEAGRSCPTGEGVFIFDCQDAESVYQRVHDLTKSMANAARAGGNHMTSGQQNGYSGGAVASGYGGSSYGGSSRGAAAPSGFSQANWANPSSIHTLSQPGSSKRSKENDYASRNNLQAAKNSQTTLPLANDPDYQPWDMYDEATGGSPPANNIPPDRPYSLERRNNIPSSEFNDDGAYAQIPPPNQKSNRRR